MSNFIIQKLSALVRARLLFQDEIAIDSLNSKMLDKNLMERLIQRKSEIDSEMKLTLRNTIVGMFLLYLVVNGQDFSLPIWNISVSEIPGLSGIILFFCSFGLSMVAISFINSQAYDALIDQIILKKSGDALIDPDIVKASYHAEFLVYKVLRENFNISYKDRIEIVGNGRIVNRILLACAIPIVIVPFFIAAVFLLITAITTIKGDVFSIMINVYSAVSVIYAVSVVILTSVEFTCKVDLPDAQEPVEMKPRE